MPTLSQRAVAKQIESGLSDREIVLLWGSKPDGKTHIFYSLMAQHSKLGKQKVHPENYTLEFLEGVEVAKRYDRIDADNVKRQIMEAYGEKPRSNSTLTLRQKYIGLLTDLEKARIIPVVAMDGIEMLPKRAFTAMKMVNEQQLSSKPGKRMGPAFLLSGAFSARKLPANFWMHCKEVQAGKIDAAEVHEFIHTIAPGKQHLFNTGALKKIAELDSTLEMSAYIRRSLEYMREKELKIIGEDVIGRVSDRSTWVKSKLALAA